MKDVKYPWLAAMDSFSTGGICASVPTQPKVGRPGVSFTPLMAAFLSDFGFSKDHGFPSKATMLAPQLFQG
jgi:hypothetical protein